MWKSAPPATRAQPPSRPGMGWEELHQQPAYNYLLTSKRLQAKASQCRLVFKAHSPSSSCAPAYTPCSSPPARDTQRSQGCTPGLAAGKFTQPQPLESQLCFQLTHLHVLLARRNQLVIHDVVRGVPQAIQRAAGVQVRGHAGARVDVLADALEPRRVLWSVNA